MPPATVEQCLNISNHISSLLPIFFPSGGQRLMGHTANIKYLIYASDWISSIRQTSVWSWASEYKCWGSNIKRWKKADNTHKFMSILLFCYHCFCCFPLRELPDFDFFFHSLLVFNFYSMALPHFLPWLAVRHSDAVILVVQACFFPLSLSIPLWCSLLTTCLKNGIERKGKCKKERDEKKKWIYGQFPFFIKKKYHHLWWVHKFSNNLTDIRARKNIACAQKSSRIYNDSA